MMITISLSAVAAMLPSPLQVLIFFMLLIPTLLAAIHYTAHGDTTSKHVDRNCGIALVILILLVFVAPNFIQIVK